VAVKWGLAPFALFGVWTRQWWAGAGVLVVLCVVTGPMWFDYVRVVLDARGNTVGYMLGEWPMMLIPLIAWWSSTRRRQFDVQPVGIDREDARRRPGTGLADAERHQ
jgi:hypothetical protein